ncbi:MAG TPA: OmpA family protein [Ferruginibacter sp.]|nr:OmpA family protein [Ferruginibacter sp.]HPH90443.1 OmpA family protein [Ferruginibacter sp.]
MKIICSIIALIVSSFIAEAQIIDAKQAAKSKVENRANNKTEEAIDEGLDKVEQGIKGIFKKKKKKESTVDENSTEKNAGNSEVNNSNTAGTAATAFKLYSKFDFVPGEKVLYYDDFARVETGDFPAEFNTDASGEVITLEGKQGKWLNLTKNGSFIPENINELAENFTLEFNAGIQGTVSNNLLGFGFNFNTDKSKLMTYRFTSGSFLYLHPGAKTASVGVEAEGSPAINNDFKMEQWDDESNNFARVSLWRQKNRLRLYINETKMMDIPRFFAENKPYYLSFFRDFFNDCNFFLTDIKYAVGAADTRNKLISTGKFSTTGILFTVNSDKINPSSYGTLKEIADVLKENASVNIKITGHTDSDGDEGANLLLSQKRAAAVKLALSSQFGIDENRMQTDGKGESAPAEPNTSTQGKANNRRVEFTKL